jgi:hypothetical protein
VVFLLYNLLSFHRSFPSNTNKYDNNDNSKNEEKIDDIEPSLKKMNSEKIKGYKVKKPHTKFPKKFKKKTKRKLKNLPEKINKKKTIKVTKKNKGKK